ncbi:unnamed protein product [Dovyalis caffra]|uniref:non-specific serine/threonine protein kinase n=1 Tax=Dovyalis caffra TaxID=77055 RepID=A0AAV1SJA8_9ROSI|nr:unnamed protein product [Dovyalis caffra]
MGKKIYEGGQILSKFSDSCKSERVEIKGTPPPGNAEMNGTIQCSCTITNDAFCHITALSLEANQFSGTIPPQLGNLVNLTTLILSNNQLEGSLPETLAQIKGMEDFRASDNNFNGTIPEFVGNWTQLKRLEFYATGLKGPVPPAIFDLENLVDLRITDLSGPEFQLPSMSKSIKDYLVLRNINLVGVIRKVAWAWETEITLYQAAASMLRIQTGFEAHPSRIPYYQSFHVNCGGPDVESERILYEGEQNNECSNAAARNYYRLGSNWGFSCTGDFMDDKNYNDNRYTIESNSNISMDELYTTARRTPLSLTYYGYCLENGIYTVRLHFAEIELTDEELYNKVARRVFDIYIQGKLEKKNFNIKEAANGFSKNFTIVFNTTVTDGTLEIRLYWAGKGTTCIPRRGDYGPIISAISVCSGHRTYCPEPEEASTKPIVIGVVTSTVCLVFLVMGVIYWKFWYGDKYKYTRKRAPDSETCALKLDWPTRYKICVGIARGLTFLHEGSAIRVAFALQKRGKLMEIVDPKLQSEFIKEEAERMIKVALLCANASPSLRPTMPAVVSMLEGQTSIQEVMSDPSIYGDDLQLQHLKGHYQQVGDQSLTSGSTQDLISSSDKTWTVSSSTSAKDLYPPNPESKYSNISETSPFV